MIRIGFVALASAALLAACDGDRKIDTDRALDSAGSTIERGAETVGGKLDTAFQAMKRKLNEAGVQSALQHFRGLDQVRVDLDDDSTATLTGVVATDEDKRRAEELASQMRDVKRVTNAIGVISGSGSSDTVSGDTSTHHP
jgi:osmotically-inducible protein OsmY